MARSHQSAAPTNGLNAITSLHPTNPHLASVCRQAQFGDIHDNPGVESNPRMAPKTAPVLGDEAPFWPRIAGTKAQAWFE